MAKKPLQLKSAAYGGPMRKNFPSAFKNVEEEAVPLPSLAVATVPAVMAEAFIVPLCVKVAPEGIVIVSPELPISRAVPLWGSSLSTFKIEAIMHSPMN